MRDPKDIIINGKQLSDILESHKKWLLDIDGGERADLRYADLSSANLRSADLSSADLRYADLRYADLRYADLSYADLRYADLSSADLSSADLSYADLSSANLRSANLRSADLRSANLRSADLSYADLRSADLRSANLRYADLSYADLRYAKNIDFAAALVTIVPEGDIIGWKKLENFLIAKLLIPAGAKRSNATGRKCRAEYAVVLEIWKGDKQVKTGVSSHNNDFIYRVGETVKPTNSFDENRWEECASGIHFFITRIEAENY